jgi:ribosomal protein S18 acetylase RimI-like enzyme
LETNHTTISLVRVNVSAVKQLQQLSRQTFATAFAWGTAAEDLQHFLDTNFSEAKLTAELHHPESAFYFAMKGGQVTGYLKLNWGSAQTEFQDQNGLEIERIYVLEEFQGRKIGQMIFSSALQMAKKRGAAYLWLGVWDKNTGAIKFYEKNGLVPFGAHTFTVGHDEQSDILMKLELTAL